MFIVQVGVPTADSKSLAALQAGIPGLSCPVVFDDGGPADLMTQAGPHTIDWNGQDDRGRQQAAGVYLVRLQSPDGVLVHKVALVK